MQDFRQLCVLQGVSLGKKEPAEFEEYIKKEFDLRIRFADEVKVLDAEEECGMRKDLLFYIHDEDRAPFMAWQLRYGVVLWEEILYDEDAISCYPPEIVEKYRPRF